MTRDVAERLRRHGIRPSAQRVAVAQYVLYTDDHPSADRVWRAVRKRFPYISRATVYNTLRLFVNKGLLRELVFDGSAALFDCNVRPHHHFIDERTGRVYDVPWDAIEVRNVGTVPGWEVREYQVVARGRRRS